MRRDGTISERTRRPGSGYAVANAHRAVVAGADARTAAKDDDGVARVLELVVADSVSGTPSSGS